jgi:hypothetical protein
MKNALYFIETDTMIMPKPFYALHRNSTRSALVYITNLFFWYPSPEFPKPTVSWFLPPPRTLFFKIIRLFKVKKVSIQHFASILLQKKKRGQIIVASKTQWWLWARSGEDAEMKFVRISMKLLASPYMWLFCQAAGNHSCLRSACGTCWCACPFVPVCSVASTVVGALCL